MKHNLKHDFFKYSMLNIMGMLGLSCYILADTFFVANGLGSRGLTALNLAIPIYSLVHGCGLMFGVGGSIRHTILKSQNKANDTVFINTILIGLLIAFILMLSGYFGANLITRMLQANFEVFAMTSTYIKYILLFAPAFIMNEVLLAFIRNDGNPQLSMIAMLCGSFANIILDYIFIFPLKMGIFGAVLATGIAPIISLSILSIHFLKKKNTFHFKRAKWQLDLFKNIISSGLPSLITEISSGLVMIIFNLIILKISGNIGVAAYGIIANIALVVIAIYTGIAQGIQPLMSNAYGHKNTQESNLLLKYALIMVLIISLLIYLGIFIFTDQIIHLFNHDNNQQLLLLSTSGMKLYFSGIAFAGTNIIMAMYFICNEKSFYANVITSLRGLIIIIPLAFIMAFIVGLNGVWLSFTLSELVVTIIAMRLYFSVKNKSSIS